MRFNIELAEPLTAREADTLQWLLRETFDPEGLSPQSFLARGRQAQGARVVEVGPRLSFSTAWATNAISICSQASGSVHPRDLQSCQVGRQCKATPS